MVLEAGIYAKVAAGDEAGEAETERPGGSHKQSRWSGLNGKIKRGFMQGKSLIRFGFYKGYF